MLTQIPIYFDFLRNAQQENHIILKGSSRSGKTENLLRDFANEAIAGVREDYAIVGNSYSFTYNSPFAAMKNLLPSASINDTRMEMRYKKANFYFKYFSKEAETKGRNYGKIFFNECNEQDYKYINSFSRYATEKIYYDYNPSHEFWIKDLKNKNNILETTWLDNPFVTETQRAFFKMIRERALKPKASNYDKWYYRVYYLGEYGNLVGNVFQSITQITDTEYQEQTKGCRKLYGNDFGYSNDPCALVEVCKVGNKLFIKELFYRNQTNDFQLAEVIKENCSPNFYIICDFGGGGDARMNNLAHLTGYGFAKKNSGLIQHGISLMQGIDIYIVGDNTMNEFKGYEFKDGKFTETNNHSIDAARYAYEFGIRNGHFF